MKKVKVQGNLPVLVTHEDGNYYAHCLPFNLISEGKTLVEAKMEMGEMIFEYIKHFLEIGKPYFMMDPAPSKYWELYAAHQPIFPNIPQGVFEAKSPNRIEKFMKFHEQTHAPA